VGWVTYHNISFGGAEPPPVRQLVLTIPPTHSPNTKVPWIHCVGLLPPTAVLAAYDETDALLFLSAAESYGLPLVEAMWIGLPIVCPDLPYARALCGNEAIYFESDDINSLHRSLSELHARLARGWWPDWSSRLSAIPSDWSEVAEQMLRILFRDGQEATAASETGKPE
jgi:glycosyltransferase involved in cell wall biosynthesis